MDNLNLFKSLVPFFSASLSSIAISHLIINRFLQFVILSFTLLVIIKMMIGWSTKSTPSRLRQPPLPPGPKPWPLVGCIPEMLRNKPTFQWMHRIMKEMNSHIICIRLGKVHVIVVSSPEIARDFLKRNDASFASRPNSMSAHLSSGGYLTTTISPLGDQWMKMRTVLVSHLFSPARHSWLYKKRVAESDNLVRYIYNQCQGNFGSSPSGLVNIRVASQHYCANVIRQMIFSKRFFGTASTDGGPGEQEIEHVDAAFTILKYIYSFCISDYLPFLRWIVDLDGHESIVRTAVQSVRKYQDPEVEERIQQWHDGTKKQEEDLLDVLINLKDKDNNPLLSTKEIKAQILEIMIAAVDNPSNACEWAFAEMINKPELLKSATEELDRVVGGKRQVQESDIPHLNYIKAIAKEAFRLHPIAPFNVPHVSTQDTIVSGYFIPKGSHLLLSRHALGRNEDVWEDPLRFDPDRHLGKINGSDCQVMLTDHDLRLISFSTGRRGCVGVRLGTSMSVMLLARLLHAFSWELPPNQLSVDFSELREEIYMEKPFIALAKPRLDEHLYLSPSLISSTE